MNKSLRNKLITAFLVIIISSLTLLTTLFFYLIQTHLNEQMEINLNEQVQITKSILESDWPNSITHLQNKILFNKDHQIRLTVIDAQGMVLVDSNSDPKTMSNHRDRPEFTAALAGKTGKSIHRSMTLKKKMIYLAKPISIDGRIVGAARLAVPEEILHNIVQKISLFLFIAILFILLSSIILARYLADNIARPILKLAQMAQKVADGNYGIKIEHLGFTKEINDLGQAFNTMSEKLRYSLEKIKLEKSRLEKVLDTMPDSIIVLDQKKTVQYINPAAVSKFHVSLEEINQKSYLGLFRNQDFIEAIANISQKKNDLHLQIMEFETQCLDIYLTITGKNKEELLIVLIRDITELKQVEQMRKDFVANVSHELKTPLTSILGFTETLLEVDIDEQKTKERFLKIIQDESHRLLRLVNDLLSLSRIENQKPECYLTKSIHHLPNTISAIIKKFLPLTEESQISLKFHNSAPEIDLFYFDEDALEQILINLIDNAIKYTPKNGTIDITLENKAKILQICVSDNGSGIPQQDLLKIFQRFYRTDKARSRKLGGTGLGLSIVKHLVEIQNGTVWVTSIVGKGSDFYFTLPKP